MKKHGPAEKTALVSILLALPLIFFSLKAAFCDDTPADKRFPIVTYDEKRNNIHLSAIVAEVKPDAISVFLAAEPNSVRIDSVKLVREDSTKIPSEELLRGKQARKAYGVAEKSRGASSPLPAIAMGAVLLAPGAYEGTPSDQGSCASSGTTACSSSTGVPNHGGSSNTRAEQTIASVGTAMILLANDEKSTKEEVVYATFNTDTTQDKKYTCEVKVKRGDRITAFAFLIDLTPLTENKTVEKKKEEETPPLQTSTPEPEPSEPEPAKTPPPLKVDITPPPQYIEDTSHYHCQGGRLLIIAGVFDRAYPEHPKWDPDRLSRKQTDPAIKGTLKWARHLNIPHLHMVAYPTAYGGNPMQMDAPYEIRPMTRTEKENAAYDKKVREAKKKQKEEAEKEAKKNGKKEDAANKEEQVEEEDDDLQTSWQPALPAGLRPEEASRRMAAKWNDCCHYDEVVIFMHGSAYTYPKLLEGLPALLANKPVRKLSIWSCRSLNKFFPGGTGMEHFYENICGIVRPKDCPCGCYHDECNTLNADGDPAGKCPMSHDNTVIYASYVVGNKAAKLGLDPKDGSTPFTTPDGMLREITVEPDGTIKVAPVNAATGHVKILGDEGVKSDPELVRKTEKGEEEDGVTVKDKEREVDLEGLKKESKVIEMSKLAKKQVTYYGPKCPPDHHEGCVLDKQTQ